MGSAKLCAEPAWDQEFIRTLSGNNPQYPIEAHESWSKKMNEILMRYAQRTDAKIKGTGAGNILASSLPPLQTNENIQDGLVRDQITRFYRAFRQFRTEADKVNSPWFSAPDSGRLFDYISGDQESNTLGISQRQAQLIAENTDSFFVQVINGEHPAFPLSEPDVWKRGAETALLSLRESPGAVTTQIPALSVDQRPIDASVKNSLKKLYGSYRVFRTDTPNQQSDFFLNEAAEGSASGRLEERIDDVFQSLKALSEQDLLECLFEPRDVLEIFDQAASKQEEQIQASVVEPEVEPEPEIEVEQEVVEPNLPEAPAEPVGTNRALHLARAAAIRYADSINFLEVKPNPEIRARPAGIKPPRSDVSQWPGNNSTIDAVVIHHTVTRPDIDMFDLRALAENRNFSDIAYHYAIGPNGTIHEGRSIEYQGSHVNVENPRAIGIVILGNMEPYHYDQNPTGYWIDPDRKQAMLAEAEAQLRGARSRGDARRISHLERQVRRIPSIEAPTTDDYTLNKAQLDSIARLIKTLNDPSSQPGKVLASKNMKVNITEITGHRHIGETATACPGEGCIGLPEAIDRAWDRQGPPS